MQHSVLQIFHLEKANNVPVHGHCLLVDACHNCLMINYISLSCH